MIGDEALKILINAGSNVNTQDKNGNSALMAAAQRGYLEIINILLDAGANTEIRNKKMAMHSWLLRLMDKLKS